MRPPAPAASFQPMESFLKGLIMGFCIAAPVGPIGLLCIRRSIADGRLAGFVSGLGAATADVFLGSASWWLLLSTGANWLGSKIGAHRLHVINLASGGLIVAFGLWQIVGLLLRR